MWPQAASMHVYDIIERGVFGRLALWHMQPSAQKEASRSETRNVTGCCAFRLLRRGCVCSVLNVVF